MTVVFLFVFVFLLAIPASGHQGEVESGTRRKVKRQLSFQRYCHASRLLRSLVPHTPGSLHLLDDNYLGQAAVRTHTQLQQVCVCVSLLFPVLSVLIRLSFFSLQQMLSKVGTWNFDIFLFDRLTNGEANVLPPLPPPHLKGSSTEILTF